MTDREKVIGHLNDCMEASRQDNQWVFVRKNIVNDALTLLKEQGDEITALSIALAMYEKQDIVRCRDCKYIEHLWWLDDANGFECYVCRKHSFTGRRTPDWFCADGERQ